MFNKSEQTVVNRIKSNQTRGNYDFWLVYDGGKCIDYEGGFDLGHYNSHFRNQYTILDDRTVRQNWHDLTDGELAEIAAEKQCLIDHNC